MEPAGAVVQDLRSPDWP
jgi:transposase